MQIVGANNTKKKTLKSLIYINIRISHKVPIVLFEAQIQVLPLQVARFVQVIAWGLVNGLQPNTISSIKKKHYSMIN